MKKTYLLGDLCCANCAAAIERGVAKIEGVKSASVSFLTTKLVVEAEEEKDIPVDSVVVAVGQKPYNAQLCDELRAMDIHAKKIGDVKRPRKIVDAVQEGFWSAMGII